MGHLGMIQCRNQLILKTGKRGRESGIHSAFPVGTVIIIWGEKFLFERIPAGKWICNARIAIFWSPDVLMGLDNDLQYPLTSQKERPVDIMYLLMVQHHMTVKYYCSKSHLTSIHLTISLQELPGMRTCFKNVTSIIQNIGYARKNDPASLTNEVYKKKIKRGTRNL